MLIKSFSHQNVLCRKSLVILMPNQANSGYQGRGVTTKTRSSIGTLCEEPKIGLALFQRSSFWPIQFFFHLIKLERSENFFSTFRNEKSFSSSVFFGSVFIFGIGLRPKSWNKKSQFFGIFILVAINTFLQNLTLNKWRFRPIVVHCLKKKKFLNILHYSYLS